MSGASWDNVSSISLDRTQTDLLTKRKAETQDGIVLDSSSSKTQYKHIKLSPDKGAQQIHVKIDTQSDDETLLNVIKSADVEHAVQLVKGNNHFSQDGLDRALISACHRGLKILVQELVCLGANVQFKDTLENTPLLICAENGFIDIVRFLLKKKADVNASNSAGDTALILSIRAAGSLEMVRILLDQNGIDISHQNMDGYTALMKAVEARDVDVIKILMDIYKKEELDWNASRKVCNPCCLGSIGAVNSKGMSAERIADKRGLGNIFKILKKHSTSRVSPVMITTKRRDTESLNILLNCQFVDKQDISDAFEEIFKQLDVKKEKVITRNDIVIIKRLLECGAEINRGWHGQVNPMYVALKMGDHEIVELLCQHLDQPQQLVSQCSSWPLIEATKSGRCDLIKLLLKYKADINNNNYYRGSPLDCALSHGHLECAKLLVQHGAKMDIKSALQSAVTQQLPEYMNFVCENYQQEVVGYAATVDNELNKLLVSASKGGNLDIIGRLLDASADVNHELDGKTPLGESKDGDVARFLINRGAKVNFQLRDGETMLINILNKRNNKDSSTIEVVKVLLENGASVKESGNKGKTPLMVAACQEGVKKASRKKRVAMLQILLDHGADISSQDKRGNTALMIAIHGRCPQNVLFLLEFHKRKNIGINVQNNKGKTALMYAVTHERAEIVEKLIYCGADVNIKDMNGNTPLFYARNPRSDQTIMLKTLINAGSDVNCQNNDGFSPLMMAARHCWKDGITILLDSGADVNAVNEKDCTKTALSFLLDCENRYFKSCLGAFLRKGASSSYMKSGLLHRMIHGGKIDSIPELIRSGMGPVEAKSVKLLPYIDGCKGIAAVSPLCVSLLAGNVSLARYFVGNLFLTNSDVTSLTGNKFLRRVHQISKHQDCLNFLEEFSSQPLSLVQLAFVTVSSAVGSSPGRENRVNILPLPQVMKDKLRFRSQELQLNITNTNENYLHFYFEPDQEITSGSDDYIESDSFDESSFCQEITGWSDDYIELDSFDEFSFYPADTYW